PLCRRLAELLGGTVDVQSTPGLGSTFTAIVPIWYSAPTARPDWTLDPGRVPVLVVEDEPESILIYRKFLASSPYQVMTASNVREAREALAAIRPRAIVLDIMLKGEETWTLLSDLKRRPETAAIPVVVVTYVEDEHKAYALGADGFVLKPLDRTKLTHV